MRWDSHSAGPNTNINTICMTKSVELFQFWRFKLNPLWVVEFTSETVGNVSNRGIQGSYGRKFLIYYLEMVHFAEEHQVLRVKCAQWIAIMHSATQNRVSLAGRHLMPSFSLIFFPTLQFTPYSFSDVITFALRAFSVL